MANNKILLMFGLLLLLTLGLGLMALPAYASEEEFGDEDLFLDEFEGFPGLGFRRVLVLDDDAFIIRQPLPRRVFLDDDLGFGFQRRLALQRAFFADD